MRQVRYQIFISSTFRDLQKERQAVLDAILSLSHFPAGMELFPASDATPWEIIERVIDDSDYYVLIVGGMYGSTDTKGISYTEREYDYAKSKGIPILAFLHENPDAIPAGKVELQADAQRKLAAFREKLQTHHCKYWRDAQDLQYKVAVGLVREMNLNPAMGWVRANDVAKDVDAKLLADAQIAAEEATLQRKLREDAERRVQSLEEALAALKRQEAEARAVIAAAAEQEAAAIAKERTAERALRDASIGSVSTQSDVPESFILSSARALLDGKLDNIYEFVTWASTPQGADFWSAESDRIDNGEELSPEAETVIRLWVERASQSSSTDMDS
ncbi:MAG: DUF4062 domain-containing protein [Acidobacteriota bacterium]|nr:DUF4062 domain-containing protein [Acidobacteriota bacterium]